MAAVSSALFCPLGLLINPPHKYPLAPADGERQVAYCLSFGLLWSRCQSFGCKFHKHFAACHGFMTCLYTPVR